MHRAILFLIVLILCAAKKQEKDHFLKLAEAAEGETKLKVKYAPEYVRIKYPGGDVPENTGVCTDLVIRAYRKLGLDLQKEVHEDMEKNFSKYPKFWGRKSTDAK